MFRDWSYKEVLDKADAIKQMGLDEVFLNKGAMPYHVATGCKSGGSHRIGMDTSVWFYAASEDLPCTLRWSFDLEPREANGKGTYFIDIEGIRRVLALLPLPVAVEFRAFLKAQTDAIEGHAKELSEAASREYAAWALLSII